MGRVFANRIHIIDELKTKLQRAVTLITPEILRKVKNNLIKRLN